MDVTRYVVELEIEAVNVASDQAAHPPRHVRIMTQDKDRGKCEMQHKGSRQQPDATQRIKKKARRNTKIKIVQFRRTHVCTCHVYSRNVLEVAQPSNVYHHQAPQAGVHAA